MRSCRRALDGPGCLEPVYVNHSLCSPCTTDSWSSDHSGVLQSRSLKASLGLGCPVSEGSRVSMESVAGRGAKNFTLGPYNPTSYVSTPYFRSADNIGISSSA